MGSPVSPIVCNPYMEAYEQKALATAPHPPWLWKRYVDDTFTIVKRKHSQEFTDHLNSIDDNIKWTTEIEAEVAEDSGRSLPFLDVLMTSLKDGSFKTTVFRKPTHTNQYLNFSSNHPIEHKRGVVKTLIHRAEVVVSNEEDRAREK